jgi:hypothetical protein
MYSGINDEMNTSVKQAKFNNQLAYMLVSFIKMYRGTNDEYE